MGETQQAFLLQRSLHENPFHLQRGALLPAAHRFDQSLIAAPLDADALVTDSGAFFSCCDWSVVKRWQAARSSRGRPAHPESASLKAYLIRIRVRLELHHPTAQVSPVYKARSALAM